MELISLDIEKKQFGPEKGKLIAKIRIGDDKGTISMEMPPSVSARLVHVAIDEIDKATATACDDFRSRLLASVAHVPQALPPPLPPVPA
jgi:hypothetical protein